MLIALNWIADKLSIFCAFISDTLSKTSVSSINSLLTGHTAVMICVIVFALLLCFLGFKLHKLISGITAAAGMAYLGWLFAEVFGSSYISVKVLTALIFGMTGFFLFYVLYQGVVILAGFLFAWAMCAAYMPGSAPTWIWIAASLIFSIGWCILYVRKKNIMTALTGAVLLCLALPAGWTWPLKASLSAAAAVIGIPIQTRLIAGAKEKRRKQKEEYYKKYIDNPSSLQAALLKNSEREVR